jgi:hypothetical protein
MIPKRVYIAGPYSKGDVMLNIREAIFAADWVIAAGNIPFLPHLTGFWHVISPKPYEKWLELDMAWLRQCDCVIRLPGESSGADGEVAEAKALGLPIFASVPEFITWANA